MDIPSSHQKVATLQRKIIIDTTKRICHNRYMPTYYTLKQPMPVKEFLTLSNWRISIANARETFVTDGTNHAYLHTKNSRVIGFVRYGANNVATLQQKIPCQKDD